MWLPPDPMDLEKDSQPPGPRVHALAAARKSAGADQVFSIGLRDQLRDSLGDATQAVALIVLGQKLGHVRA